MGILDGFIGFSELTATFGKDKFRVHADAAKVKGYLKKQGIKATVLENDGMCLVAVAEWDKKRTEHLLELEFGS